MVWTIGHVLRRDSDDVPRRALYFEDVGRMRWRPKLTWRRQAEEDILKIELEKEDARGRKNWCSAVYDIV